MSSHTDASELRALLEEAISGSDVADEAREKVVAAGAGDCLDLVIERVKSTDAESSEMTALMDIAMDLGDEVHNPALRALARKRGGGDAIIALARDHDARTLKLILASPALGEAVAGMAANPSLVTDLIGLMKAYASKWKLFRKDVLARRKGAKGDLARFLDEIVAAGRDGRDSFKWPKGPKRISARPPKDRGPVKDEKTGPEPELD